MSALKIKYSPLIDFGYCMLALYDPPPNKKDPEKLSFEQEIVEIEEIKKDLKNLLTSFLSNDINYFIGEMSSYLIPLCLGLDGNMSVKDFINYFEKLEADKIVSLYLDKVFDFHDSVEEFDVKLQVQAYSQTSDESIEEVVITEFLQNPSQISNRMKSFFNDFYNNVFIHVEEKLKDMAPSMIQQLQKWYNDTPDEFNEYVIKLNYEEVITGKVKIIYFLSCINNFMLGFHMFSQRSDLLYCVIGYGYKAHSDAMAIESNYILMMKLLSDETKLQIIKHLSFKKAYANELAESLNLSRATISYHIKKLTIIGILSIKYTEGRLVYYEVNFQRIRNIFNDYINFLEQKG